VVTASVEHKSDWHKREIRIPH